MEHEANETPFADWFWWVAYFAGEKYSIADLPHIYFELGCIEVDRTFEPRWYVDDVEWFTHADGTITRAVYEKDYRTPLN